MKYLPMMIRDMPWSFSVSQVSIREDTAGTSENLFLAVADSTVTITHVPTTSTQYVKGLTMVAEGLMI